MAPIPDPLDHILGTSEVALAAAIPHRKAVGMKLGTVLRSQPVKGEVTPAQGIGAGVLLEPEPHRNAPMSAVCKVSR